MNPKFRISRRSLLGLEREIVPGKVDRTAKKAAFFASYGEGVEFSRSIVETVRELSANGYDVVLVRSSNSDSKAAWPESETSIRPTLIYRPNAGYDFGSWATAIHSFPKLAVRDQVLLINDSLVGPFGSMKPLLEHFESSSADVWAATSSKQIEMHLQSFMMGFHRGVLGQYPLKKFWQSIKVLGTKDEIIQQHEIGLSRLIEREMLTSESFLPADIAGKGLRNSAISSWQVLLRNQFPFVKRELLISERFPGQRDQIRALIQDECGQDALQWFEGV